MCRFSVVAAEVASYLSLRNFFIQITISQHVISPIIAFLTILFSFLTVFVIWVCLEMKYVNKIDESADIIKVCTELNKKWNVAKLQSRPRLVGFYEIHCYRDSDRSNLCLTRLYYLQRI